jgi:ArsR family transcriptional regulator
MHKGSFIKRSFIKGQLMSPVSRRSRRASTPRSNDILNATDLTLHFEGLANPTRLKIVERLAAAAEMRVSELAEFCKVSQPRMSWHLRTLRRANVIRTRREGREVFCRLDREAIAAHLRSFVRLIAGGVPMDSRRPGADSMGGLATGTAGEPVEMQQLISEVAK